MDRVREMDRLRAIIRGIQYRRNHLPNSILTIQRELQNDNINLCKISNDGRINSSLDEDEIKRILKEIFSDRIKEPPERSWYDICVYDYQYGWLPINIKTTTTKTADNIANLAMCVHVYTDEELNLNKNYNNGEMSQILTKKIKKKEYNYNSKKDYYVLVVNKKNNKDIIVNSIKGLTQLKPNLNNIPYQVCWDKNRIFNYKTIKKNIKMLLDALHRPSLTWRESFLHDIRKIKL